MLMAYWETYHMYDKINMQPVFCSVQMRSGQVIRSEDIPVYQNVPSVACRHINQIQTSY